MKSYLLTFARRHRHPLKGSQSPHTAWRWCASVPGGCHGDGFSSWTPSCTCRLCSPWSEHSPPVGPVWWQQSYYCHAVMKMENGVPNVVIQSTSLAFRAIISPMVPDVTTLMSPTWLCDSLPETSVQTTILSPSRILSLLNGHLIFAIAYIEPQHLHIFRHRVSWTIM